MTNFERCKEELPSKKKFYSLLTNRKSSHREYEHVFNVWNKFEMNTIEDYRDF